MENKERRHLTRKRRALLKKLAAVEQFVRGSVVLMKRRCTYAHCRKCASGQRHPTWVLTVSRAGKTRTVYLGKKRVADARRMVANYRKMQQWIEQIAQINVTLLTDRVLSGKGAGDGSRRGRS